MLWIVCSDNPWDIYLFGINYRYGDTLNRGAGKMDSKYKLLVNYLSKLGSVIVAFSGGVDSSLLLAASKEALGRDNVLAVTASSLIDPPGELEAARETALSLGVKWQPLESHELNDLNFLANTKERCYYCKKRLLKELLDLAQKDGFNYVVEGSNLDDLQDFRPGYKAVCESGVLSPLMEVKMTKEDIRAAAKEVGLLSWDKPSGACLASRIPYGQAITVERLKRIAAAESLIHDLGVVTVRVRDYGETARLEVPFDCFQKLTDHKVRQDIVERFKKLGYKYITLDLEGYRTGSMN